MIWLRVFASQGQSEARTLAVTSSSIVVAGVFASTLAWDSNTMTAKGSQDLFVAALSTSGTAQWILSAGTAKSTEVTALLRESETTFYVAGSFQTQLVLGSTTLSASSSVEGFVAKLQAEGNQPRWPWAVAPGGQLQPSSLALQGATHLLVGGSFQADITIPGKNPLKSNGLRTLGLLRLNRTGGVVSDGLGALGNATLHGLAVCPSGLTYMAGSFQGSTKLGSLVLQPEQPSDPGDMFVAELDVSFQVKRTLTFPDRGFGEALAVGCGNKDVWVAGTFEQSITWSKELTSATKGQQDVFVAQLDPGAAPNITLKAQQTLGSSDDDQVRAITLDAFGGVFVAGESKGEVTFPIKPKAATAPLVGAQTRWLWKVTP